ncbi:hypothetical protein ACFFRR_009666 [Megaselia abdita]
MLISWLLKSKCKIISTQRIDFQVILYYNVIVNYLLWYILAQKKIQHIFTNLLNYYLWYAQTKSKILDRAENILKDRDDLMKQLKKLKNEKESIKVYSKNIHEDINLKTKKNPELAEKIEFLKNQISSLDKRNLLLQKSKKYCEENITQSKSKYKDLEEKVISDDEFINLLHKENSLEDELKELCSNSELETNNKKMRLQRIHEMEPLVSGIGHILKKTLDSFDVTSDKQMKRDHDELKKKKKHKTIIQRQIEEAIANIDELHVLREIQGKEYKYKKNHFCKFLLETQEELDLKIKESSTIENMIQNAVNCLKKEEELDTFLTSSVEIIKYAQIS